MKIIRAVFGKKDTPKELREYHLEGDRRVGTISEFKKVFPNEHFEIVDTISGDEE